MNAVYTNVSVIFTSLVLSVLMAIAFLMFLTKAKNYDANNKPPVAGVMTIVSVISLFGFIIIMILYY